MARKFTPKVVTANDLLAGDVIYLSEAQIWVRDFSLAALHTDETAANTALAFALTQPNTAVGVYLMDATATANGAPKTTHFRETFRARGPSNYAHGKQAEV